MHPISDAPHLEEIRSINFKPIFILGLHRSGTSILYKLLSKTNNYNIVTAYHLIYFDQLLNNYLTSDEDKKKEKLSQEMHKFSKDRGIDRLKLDADFPEEYGFLLGQKSTDMTISKKNIQYFRDLCKKIQFISNNDKPVLLKNPYDFANFIKIVEFFPNARFIFIHRQPYRTLSSTIKAVQQIFSQPNWYTSQLFRQYVKIYENLLLLKSTQLVFLKIPFLGMLYLLYQMRQGTHYFLRNINQLDSGQYINVTYEELCADADSTIHKIQSFLGENIKEGDGFQSQIQVRKIKLYPLVSKFRSLIYYLLRDYFDFWGYSIDDD